MVRFFLHVWVLPYFRIVQCSMLLCEPAAGVKMMTELDSMRKK